MNSAEKVAADIVQWKLDGIKGAELMTLIAEDQIGWPYAWGATGQLCTVANRQARMNNPKIGDGDKNLIKKRCQVLNGSSSSCDGCKYYPQCERTRLRDCIAFVNNLLDEAGIAHYGAGCTTMWNHAANWDQKGLLADMPKIPCLVFQRQSKQEPNKMQHVGYYDGEYVYHESGEVKKQKLSEYPWTNYAIPKGMGGDIPVTFPTLRKGDKGEYVTLMQTKLIQLGYDLEPYGADGKFGNKTLAALKQFQTDKGLKADGVCGSATWDALMSGEIELYMVTIPHLSKPTATELVDRYGGVMVKENEQRINGLP